jgi:hypothetical protein
MPVKEPGRSPKWWKRLLGNRSKDIQSSEQRDEERDTNAPSNVTEPPVPPSSLGSSSRAAQTQVPPSVLAIEPRAEEPLPTEPHDVAEPAVLTSDRGEVESPLEPIALD